MTVTHIEAGHLTTFTNVSDAGQLNERLARLFAPGDAGPDFDELCDAARGFGRAFHEAGFTPERMVVSLKETLALTYGAMPSLAAEHDASAFSRHLAPCATWYPRVLAAALDGFFVLSHIRGVIRCKHD